MKKLIDEQNVFRSEVMVRKDINDEIQRSIFILNISFKFTWKKR